MNLNHVHLIGRLVRDPELRSLPSGTAVCTFSLATNSAYLNKEGKREEESEFHNVVVYGKTAETSAQYLKKGRELFVEGRLKTRSWDDQQGIKHWKTEVIADRIQFGAKAGAKAEPAGEMVTAPVEEAAAMAPTAV